MYINASRTLSHQPAASSSLAERTGDRVGAAEQTAISLMLGRVYRFRVRHAIWYGLIAFLIGGALVGGFTMSTYGNWAYETIDLARALWQVICGSLGGGIVLAVLAFAYARMAGETSGPLAEAGLVDTGD